MKIYSIFQNTTKISEKNDIPLHFLRNFFMSGLTEDSWIFMSVSASICCNITHHVASGKAALDTCERKRVEKANHVSRYENSFNLPDPLKEFQGPTEDPGPHFEKHCPRARAVDMTERNSQNFQM